AESLDELGGKLLLERAAVGSAADRDLLESRRAFQHLTRAVDPEVIGNHQARDDRLAQPPARLDHPHVGTGNRTLCEHDPGGLGIEKRLNDDPDARAGEQSDALPIGDGRVRVRRPPDLAQSGAQPRHRGNVEQCQVLAGEAGQSTVLIHGGRAGRQGGAQRLDLPGDLLQAGIVTRGDGFDDVAGQGDSGWNRKAIADRLPEPDRLRAVERDFERLLQKNDSLHPSTVTSPLSPSTRTRTPSAIRSVASRVPTTPGIPYSRATIAD